MNRNKNILIVGGTGFIGYHLAKRSLQKGWDVTSISSRPPKRKRYLKKVKYISCDICNKKILKKKIKKYFNYVVNLGGYVDHSNKKKTLESHYFGSKNLAEIFFRKNIDSFIQIGSSAEYGKLKSPQSEISKCEPLSVYSKAKFLATSHLINISKKSNFPCTVLRFYQVYGPRQDFNRFLPVVINGCIKNKIFPCSDGKQFRDFLYVDDAIDAIFKCLNNTRAIGEIINIGYGKPKKIKNIINLIKRISKGGKPQFGKINLRQEENLKTFPSIKKAKKIIGWKPQISFNIGLKKTIKSYENIK